MSKKEKKGRMESSVKRQPPKPFEVGREVYFNAFSKQDPDMLYVCQGEITRSPDGEKTKTYRVRVNAVADRSVTGRPSEEQRTLIGRAITKRRGELTLRLGAIFQPKQWLS